MSLPRDTPSGGQMRNNWNPVDNTVAAIRYIAGRYGTPQAIPGWSRRATPGISAIAAKLICAKNDRLVSKTASTPGSDNR